MSVGFNVAVADTVTYYWRMAYVLGQWYAVALVPESQAVNGGPTYGASLSGESSILDLDGTGNVTDEGRASRPRVYASFYNSTNDGCPGLAFMRTRFTRGNGITAIYTVRTNGETILGGLIRSGSATDTAAPGLPSGGNPEACAADEDGITGGNTT